MPVAFAKVAFTPSVLAQQDRMASGRYARLLSDDRQGGDRIGPAERAFIEHVDGFYQRPSRKPAGPMSSSAAGRAGSCACWTIRPSPMRICAATASTSAWAT